MNIKQLAQAVLPRKVQDADKDELYLKWQMASEVLGCEQMLAEVFQILDVDKVAEVIEALDAAYNFSGEVGDSKVQDRDTLGHRIGRRLGMTSEAITQETFDAFKEALWRATQTSTKAVTANGKKKVIQIQCTFPKEVNYGNKVPAKLVSSLSKDGQFTLQYRPDNGDWQAVTDITGQTQEELPEDQLENQ